MDSARIVYAPRPDATKEGEIDALASVYAFLIRVRTKNKAAEDSGGEDDAKGDNHARATLSIP